MARSMTSFGRFSDVINGREITVELKSVNSKFLDYNIKLPRNYGMFEDKIKTYLQKGGISRGKLDVYLSINEIEASREKICVDKAYAQTYISALRELQELFGLKDDISVMTVARNTSVFTSITEEEDLEALWNDVKTVIDKALEIFVMGREAEGKRLKEDLLEKKNQVLVLKEELAKRAETYTKNYREKLEARLDEVLKEKNIVVDEARILTECAIFADKTAIDEELVRLDSHLVAFEEIFKSEEPVGRRLDFLLQEINREVNTSGSKCSDAKSAAIVVELKCLLEKIREQVQNLE
ncbi:MAG: YicC family protein [Ruminococcaceae bacterium]|nr:YicC family protein [Oscillospiraceae bacterium]